VTAARLQGVAVRYARLGPLDLSVAPGEIVSLVGPSGCGKSTLLRLLAGLEAPDAGTVERAAGPGETAVVFQAPTLMPWASALDNAALPLRLAGLARPQANTQAGEALAAVGLAGAEGRKPAQLSGGMAMRVSLARALVTRPRLLLLDEPFAALDEITRRTLAEDIHRLWAELKPAIVFVTHNVEEAVYMASRVVVLGAGAVQAQMTVDAPLPRPPGFRADAAFRHRVEQVSSALAQGVAA
jgi:NitT/TauT family transport system ATP-binding protein